MIGKLSDTPMRPSPSGRFRAPTPESSETVDECKVGVEKEAVSTTTERDIVLPRRYDACKRFFDLLFGVPLGILLLPMILFTAVLVRFTSHGPAFYTQSRVGRFGHCFRIYKIRTMRHNAESGTGAKWATKNDSRVTWIGKILRKTHLDELPQILNVIKGDMSLVGPRPERPEFTTLLEAAIPHYKDRMLVRPGVTGLAQVYLPPDTNVDSVKRKLIYDIRYLTTMSLWLDLRLLLATFLQAIGIPCRVVQFCLWLPRMSSIEGAADREPTSVNQN
jgi:lipopolysaccharide/colanic/teichoic acid biosynthesis glycosyltransferase